MGKFSPRTLLWGIFCVWVTVFLYGCVQPLSLDSFVKDDEVQEIVEKSAGTVIVRGDSVFGPMGSNKKITGLSPGKYYMIEEWDDENYFVDVQFITANGERSKNLTDIGKVAEDVKEIGGLINNHQYRITTPEALSGDVPYTALNPPDSAQMATNTGGMIILPGPEDDKSFTIYTFTPPPALASCEVIEVHFSSASASAGDVSRARLSQDGDIITLIDQVTVTDYIFYEYIAPPDKKNNFYILRVASDKAPDPEMPGEEDTGDLKVTVNLTFSADNPPQIITPTPPVTYPQSGTGIILFTVSNASQYDKITWYVDGEEVDTADTAGTSFTLNKERIEYKLVGVHTITVGATKDGKLYSAAIEVTVSP